MSRPESELVHLFRQLKAPAAARAMPKLADRARSEQWSYTEAASRQAAFVLNLSCCGAGSSNRPRRYGMAQVRPLDEALLERLDDRLRARSAQTITQAAAGRPVEAFRASTAEIPEDVPAEAELWWSWRTWGPGHVLPGAQYLTLEAALAERRMRREWATTSSARPGWSRVDPGLLWDPSWLPIFVVDGGVVIVLDLSRSDGVVAPVTTVDGQSFGSDLFAVPVAASLGEFVADRLDAIDRGEFVYREDIDLWLDADG